MKYENVKFNVGDKQFDVIHCLDDEQLSDFVSKACVQLCPELTKSLIQIVRELITIREITDLKNAEITRLTEELATSKKKNFEQDVKICKLDFRNRSDYDIL